MIKPREIFEEDGIEYEWIGPMSNKYYYDYGVWQAWEAVPIDGARVVNFVVDIETGYVDYGPCDTFIEALDFLEDKQNDFDALNNDLTESIKFESPLSDTKSRIIFMLRKNGFKIGSNYAEVMEINSDMIAINFGYFYQDANVEQLKQDIANLEDVENVRYSKWNGRMTVYLY